MELKKCQKCGKEVPKAFFDLLMGSSIKGVQSLCIMCIYEAAKEIIGDSFMFTDNATIEKFNAYCEYFKIESVHNVNTS